MNLLYRDLNLSHKQLFYSPWPQLGVADKYFIIHDPNLGSRTNILSSVTSTWGREQIYYSPWPQLGVTNKYFILRDPDLGSRKMFLLFVTTTCGRLQMFWFSVTPSRGLEQIFFILRDHNLRSRTNIFILRDPNLGSRTKMLFPWPQLGVANKYLILCDPNLGSQKCFCSLWPQLVVTNILFSVTTTCGRVQIFLFSVTPTWGRKQIFLIIHDHNLWSRTNILMYPNPFKGALFWNFNSETHFSKGNKMLLIIQFRSVISMWGFKQISLKELYFGTLILKPIFQK